MSIKILIYILFLSIGFLLGMIAKTISYKNLKPNGKIILDHNEEGNERICFALNLEYDDFKKYSTLVFEVENRM